MSDSDEKARALLAALGEADASVRELAQIGDELRAEVMGRKARVDALAPAVPEFFRELWEALKAQGNADAVRMNELAARMKQLALALGLMAHKLQGPTENPDPYGLGYPSLNPEDEE